MCTRAQCIDAFGFIAELVDVDPAKWVAGAAEELTAAQFAQDMSVLGVTEPMADVLLRACSDKPAEFWRDELWPEDGLVLGWAIQMCQAVISLRPSQDMRRKLSNDLLGHLLRWDRVALIKVLRPCGSGEGSGGTATGVEFTSGQLQEFRLKVHQLLVSWVDLRWGRIPPDCTDLFPPEQMNDHLLALSRMLLASSHLPGQESARRRPTAKRQRGGRSSAALPSLARDLLQAASGCKSGDERRAFCALATATMVCACADGGVGAASAALAQLRSTQVPPAWLWQATVAACACMHHVDAAHELLDGGAFADLCKAAQPATLPLQYGKREIYYGPGHLRWRAVPMTPWDVCLPHLGAWCVQMERTFDEVLHALYARHARGMWVAPPCLPWGSELRAFNTVPTDLLRRGWSSVLLRLWPPSPEAVSSCDAAAAAGQALVLTADANAACSVADYFGVAVTREMLASIADLFAREGVPGYGSGVLDPLPAFKYHGWPAEAVKVAAHVIWHADANTDAQRRSALAWLASHAAAGAGSAADALKPLLYLRGLQDTETIGAICAELQAAIRQVLPEARLACRRAQARHVLHHLLACDWVADTGKWPPALWWRVLGVIAELQDDELYTAFLALQPK